MIRAIKQILLNDLFHLKQLKENDFLDSCAVHDLIELKETIVDLLPDDALIEASVSTPRKSHLDIMYYDVINPNEIDQYRFLDLVKKCETSRLQMMNTSLDHGLSSDMHAIISKIYGHQKEYLAILDHQLVRP